MSATDDFRALRAEWQWETQVIPHLGLEALVARARHEKAETDAMAESFRFSAWLNTLREKLEREEEAAHEAWALAVDRSEWTFGKEAR
jgi:hypothetical protein